jgi:hypothetical protein
MGNNKSSKGRKLVDLTKIYPDLKRALHEDGLNNEVPVLDMKNYLVDHIIKPWLEKREQLREAGKPIPTLSKALSN